MLAAGALLQGRYKIREPLSEGGMSIVYLAEDSVLGNRVAIKEMKDHFLSPQERSLAAQQFLKEAQILANLEHPGLPRVSNFFEQDGRHYLVMDYIQGDTLEALINQHGGRLPEDMVLRIAVAVGRVLDYLHRLSPAVIFRDLKPSNIMLMRSPHIADDEQGRVKLIDFGISKIFDATQGTHTIIKGAGTPGYAPPEQYGAQGRMRTDARSDVYSLGATMYSLLTGQVPTEATDRWMNGEVLARPRGFNEEMSAQTEDLILEMMELKPEDRPATARAVVERINQILAARSARSSGAQKPARRFRSSVSGGAPEEAPPPSPVDAPTPGIYPFAGAGASSDTGAPLGGDWFSSSGAWAAPPVNGTPTAPSAPAGIASVAAPTPRGPSISPDPPLSPGWDPPSGSAWPQPPADAPSFPPPLAAAAPPPPPTIAGAMSSAAVAPPPPATPVPLSGAPANPTVRGRATPARNPLLPVLAVVATLGIVFALLSGLGLLPFARPVETPSPIVAVSSGPAPSTAASTVAVASVTPVPSPTVAVVPTQIGLTVTPAGAKIWVDDGAVAESTGSVNWVTVQPGTHTVKVRKSGYLPQTSKVEVSARQKVAVNVDLVKEATIRFTTVPVGAKIDLDGKYVGRAPLTKKGLTKGSHSYKVYATDRVSQTGNISLNPGEDANLELKLKEVAVAPAPAPVYHPSYTPPPAYRPAPPVYRPAPVYHPPAPAYRPQPRATSVDVPAPRATPR